MRTYYIYKQRAKLVNVHCDYSVYRWLPFEYIGYVQGTRELYEVFRSRRFGSWLTISFHNSFTYDTKYFKRQFHFSWLSLDKETPIERFVIADDHGRVRDYYELTSRYKKHRRGWKHGAYQEHWGSTILEMRQTITPEEIREIKDEYGIALRPCHPKRKRDPWEDANCHRVSKGWKAQSKRRKQYKVRG